MSYFQKEREGLGLGPNELWSRCDELAGHVGPSLGPQNYSSGEVRRGAESRDLIPEKHHLIRASVPTRFVHWYISCLERGSAQSRCSGNVCQTNE